MKQAILFDLDGTLLPMDMEAFTEGYFRLLAKKAAPRGYEPYALVDGIWAGTKAMVRNDGSMTNEARFWSAFAEIFGERVYDDVALFNEFYANEFQEAVRFTSPDPDRAVRAVRAARAKADTLILATNPIFPLVGVQTRLSWIGLKPEDFDDITTYETSCFCKPNPDYYREILEKNDLDPTDCLMIGNDMEEDLFASRAVHLDCFLITDCLIQRGSDPLPEGAGRFDEMIDMLERL